LIKLLSPETVGQIAAGETIERPVSVVKELVENALDAGATRVAVSLRGGGIGEIEITDDGGGIAPGELPLAVARHATSKLADAAGLAGLTTLGFRGEGLASIAAVARLRVISRAAGAQVGAFVDAHAEECGAPEPIAAPPGTRVVVRDLFANVPVRREYLRSPQAEFARVSAFLTALSLAYPRVAFRLRHDERDVWAFPPASGPDERLEHVFGREARERLVRLDGDAPALMGELGGFISLPGFERPDRRYQFLFVNGRLVRSSLVAQAWSGGYATFRMSGRFPFGVLFIELPPADVDANVHPAKSEVRLRNGKQVVDELRRAIARTLRAQAAGELHRIVSFAPPLREADFPTRVETITGTIPAAPSLLPRADDAAAGAGPALDGLRILSQLDATYILATDGRGLVLLDQHAAHERIAYEALSERAAEPLPSEPLLLPETIELTAAESARLEEVLPQLRAAGFDLELFGPHAYRLIATPLVFGRRTLDLRGFIEDLGDEYATLSPQERIVATLACHSVVRAGEALAAGEMSELLSRLQRCANPMHCPHGRPTIVRIAPEEIARRFKRP
jgi:DNA mismatch repair protein MutL